MATRNIVLAPEQDAFLKDVVQAGEYRDASEAVNDALRSLRQRRDEDRLKLERLRIAVAQGVAALERGAFTEVAEEDLDAFLDGLAEPSAN